MPICGRILGNNCNTYVMDGEKTVLIDPGHSWHPPRLFYQIEVDGLSPERIYLVILSHSHSGQTGPGLKTIKGKLSIPLLKKVYL
ncbi:MAG: MBL fold metallo-hydrolase [Thermodesulfobacteriota bacterium]|nr:MBL fold metallo-hydrolase [Thermodesulfobacteriota bacterium]